MDSTAVVRHGPDAFNVLRDPATIRARCAAITRAVGDGCSPHFRIDRSRLDEVAQRVEALTRAAWPDLQVPLHSRWRHFGAGGVDRVRRLDELLDGRNEDEQARARVDLAVVSVLLDAGAGPDWRYREAAGEQALARSEGLAVASFDAFVAGRFSSSPDDPLRVDGAVLRRLDAAALKVAFQVDAGNPMVGLEGRVALLNRLGSALAQVAGGPRQARPALLYDRIDALAGTSTGLPRQVEAADILRTVLDVLTPIWRHGAVLHGTPLGDVWPHPWAGGESTRPGSLGTTAGLVPFHKLSQWLSYSLVEPLRSAGIEVVALDALTALPEYRNGGLLIDGGVLVPRDPRVLQRRWRPGDELIVEWRALTVSLIDELAPLIRGRLQLDARQLPLGAILEGGTWAAGRAFADELRDGAPPLQIDSDGTVF